MTSNLTFLALVTFNIFLAIGIAILWIRMLRPPKEDPRLSRGLQLLQSKITILEDLSDRTDNQVKQLIQILEERARILQGKVLKSEEVLMKIEHATRKSMDVAQIFQDKIPHKEIVERTQTSKYVLAAHMAHEGVSIDEIAAKVDLPRNEIEFIAKVNKDQLTFDPNLVPEWAKPKEEFFGQAQTGIEFDTMSSETPGLEKIFQNQPLPDLTQMQNTQNNFKTAVRQHEEIERVEAARQQAMDEKLAAIRQAAITTAENIKARTAEATAKTAGAIRTTANQVSQTATQVSHAAVQVSHRAGSNLRDGIVRKVQFPKITLDK